MQSEIEIFYALFPEPELAKDLITLLEDYRINSRLKAEYPVLGVQISEMNVHTVSKRPSLDELANDKQRAVELIAQRLIAGTTKEQVPENYCQHLSKLYQYANHYLHRMRIYTKLQGWPRNYISS
jgi:flagellar biosynthesis chaperone FliJ